VESTAVTRDPHAFWYFAGENRLRFFFPMIFKDENHCGSGEAVLQAQIARKIYLLKV
jgi:hypothetical protein